MTECRSLRRIPCAEGVGELQRMMSMARRFTRPNGMRKALDKMAEVGPERWKEVPQMYLNLLNVLAPNARYTVDKLPHNFLYLGFIAPVFSQRQDHPLYAQSAGLLYFGLSESDERLS